MSPRAQVTGRLGLLSLAALLPFLTGCDGRAEAAVSTAYVDAAAEAAPDTVGVPVSERLWTWDIGTGISHGGPSPDGRLVSLVNWTTGQLGVWEQDTDSIRHLTGADWSTGYHLYWSTFSPDGASIAFTWEVVDGEGGRSELRVVDSGGSEEPRVVLRMPKGEMISPTDWGEPGILATADRVADSTFRVVIVDPEGDGYRTVLESRERIERPTFSPDGRTIAFERTDEIHLVPTDGGEARASGIEGVQIVGWPRHGEGLYFYDEQGDIRVVAVSGQRTIGSPRLVRRDGAGWGIGVSDDALFTSVQLEGRRVHVVEVDGDGRMLGESRPVTPLSRGRIENITENRSDWPALSPDGQTLAYVQQRRIHVASPDGRRIRELPVTGGSIISLVWGPDGESLWYHLLRPGGAVLQRYDLRTGDAVDILQPRERGLFRVALDPVRPVVYGVRLQDVDQSGIWAYDYDTGERRLVVAIPNSRYGTVSVSPDGARLAYVALGGAPSTNRLMVVPVEGGTPREIQGAPNNGAPIHWSPDGTRIFYMPSLDGPEWTLMSVLIDGGEPTAVGQFDVDFAVYSFTLNLAAGRMAFAGGSETAELWKTELATPRR